MPRGGSDAARRLQKLGRYGKFIGCKRFADEDCGCKYIRNLDGQERPEPELLDETCPECGRPLQREVGRYGPFVGCSGYPECQYIKKEPPKGTGVTCPQCKQGEIVEKRTRFGPFFGCDRYPECDFAVNNPPDAGPAVPRVRLAAARAAEELPVLELRRRARQGVRRHEAGDPEAEAAARAAKAAARAARQRPKPQGLDAKRTSAKKSDHRQEDSTRQEGATASAPRRATADTPAAAEG